MELFLRYGLSSARGYIRPNNEDSAFAGPRLLALADGMGGHAGGEVASTLTIAELASLNDVEAGDDPLALLGEAAARANESIARHVAEHPELDGMEQRLRIADPARGAQRRPLSHLLGWPLSDFVRAEEIAEVMRDVADTQGCVGRLVQVALRADSHDNVTCLVADVVDQATGSSTTPVASISTSWPS